MFLKLWMMNSNNSLHQLFIRKIDEVKHAAAKKGVRKFFFIIARNNNDWTFFGADFFACFQNLKSHAIELMQKIIGKLDVGFVDFIDKQDYAFLRSKRLTHGSKPDVTLKVFGIAI